MNGLMMRGGTPPATIELRYCPKDPMHWRVDEDRCPVCKSKIATAVYTPALERKLGPDA